MLPCQPRAYVFLRLLRLSEFQQQRRRILLTPRFDGREISFYTCSSDLRSEYLQQNIYSRCRGSADYSASTGLRCLFSDPSTCNTKTYTLDAEVRRTTQLVQDYAFILFILRSETYNIVTEDRYRSLFQTFKAPNIIYLSF